ATGVTGATATMLESTHNTVISANGTNHGVMLPLVQADGIGAHVDVFNAHVSQPIRVYPATGDALNNSATSEPFVLAPQRFYWCRATRLRQWRCGASS
ncbi:MAG: hypothetical protein IT290_05785, partial [Deltaproteobacteria bacterium]|nr:hypothetical protein [Deltaproteobacteria bacterium]